MPFIGIITDEKSENYIRREIIKNLKLSESNVLFIKEKSVENIKNIKFETIIFARKFKNMEVLNKIIENAKNLIINTDIIKNIEQFEKLNINIITYGFNSKAKITASSVEEDERLICVKEDIKTINNKIIEPEEIKIQESEDVKNIMAVVAILLIYEKKK